MSEPGSKVDPQRVLQHALEQVKWTSLILNKDNLGLNDCIICLQEKCGEAAVRYNIIGRDGTALLELSCHAHSGVLIQRPLVELKVLHQVQEDELHFHPVILSHLHQTNWTRCLQIKVIT